MTGPIFNIKLAGYFRFEVRDGETGQLKKDTGWIKNLITNQGMDWFGAGAPVFNTSFGAILLNTHCGVGTGNTTPTFTDTQLTSPLAMFPSTAGSNVESSVGTFTAGSPPYWSRIWTYSFAVGAVVGNVAEAGVGGCISSDTTPQLFSHVLIVDGSGNPTTLPVTLTDALTVTYELRHYLDVTDNTYTVSINGVTYGGTFRRATITTVPDYGRQCDYGENGIGFATNCFVYNGTIGTVNNAPSGGSSGGGNDFATSAGTYTPGSLFKSFTTTMGVGVGNVGGITAVMFFTNFGNWQFGVSPDIPKDNTKTMSFTWNVSWARFP